MAFFGVSSDFGNFRNLGKNASISLKFKIRDLLIKPDTHNFFRGVILRDGGAALQRNREGRYLGIHWGGINSETQV